MLASDVCNLALRCSINCITQLQGLAVFLMTGLLPFDPILCEYQLDTEEIMHKYGQRGNTHWTFKQQAFIRHMREAQITSQNQLAWL